MHAFTQDPYEDEDDNGLEEDQWYSDSSDHDAGWGEEDEPDMDEEDIEEEPEEPDELDMSSDEDWDT